LFEEEGCEQRLLSPEPRFECVPFAFRRGLIAHDPPGHECAQVVVRRIDENPAGFFEAVEELPYAVVTHYGCG
jgi:hypothetical protein